jgi:hypothetical protein
MKMTVKKELDIIKKVIHEDSDYAWSWLCNIAMASYDEGLDLSASNRAAARFMYSLFGIDMTDHELFMGTQVEPQNLPEYEETLR